MKESKRSLSPATLLTGKYGVLLLTVLNVGLACLVVTITRRWHFLDTAAYGNTDFMTYYLIDFRVGFVSRALPGAILYLFTKHPTVRMVTNILIVAIFLSMLLFSFLQAQIAEKALQTSDYATLLLSYLFFLNNIFWCNAFEYLGHPDIFMTLLLQIYLLCAERKRSLAYALAPVVCVVGLLIHTAFLFVGFTVVGAILWFDLLKSGKPRPVPFALFGVSCVVSLALFVVFVFFTRETTFIGADEMLELMRRKYDGPIDENYFTIYLYRIGTDDHSDLQADHFLEYLFHVSAADYSSSKMHRHLLNIVPLTVPFFGGCAYHAYRSGNRKIAYLGFFAPFVALFPALSFSTDRERFFSLFIHAQFLLLHYLVTQTDTRFLPCAAEPSRKKLSPDAAKTRKVRYNAVLAACTVAGLAYTLFGQIKL